MSYKPEWKKGDRVMVLWREIPMPGYLQKGAKPNDNVISVAPVEGEPSWASLIYYDDILGPALQGGEECEGSDDGEHWTLGVFGGWFYQSHDCFDNEIKMWKARVGEEGQSSYNICCHVRRPSPEVCLTIGDKEVKLSAESVEQIRKAYE